MSLPGVNTVIRDRFITLSRTNAPLGPRVVIIGRRTTDDATNGISDLDPFQPGNEQAVIDAYGAESDLHRGYLEATSGGATRVILIALPEDTTFAHNTGTISSSNYTALVGSNTLFDDAFAAAESAQADIIVPWGRGAGPTEFEEPATPGNDAEFGFYADNTSGTNSWAYKVAQKCHEITSNSHPCFAVLGVKPYIGAATADGGMTPARVNSHTAFVNLSDREADPFEDIGPYVSVVAAEIAPIGYNNNYDWGYSNGAAMYAGYVTTLNSFSATTNKVIFNVDGIRYNPTRTQQLSMIDKGLVPVALDFSRRPVWIDGQTFAKATSDYIRLTTLRIVFDAVQMVRSVALQFVGEPSSPQVRNALDTAVSSGLRNMQLIGELIASDFTIAYVANENKAIVDLSLTPAFELRNIEVRVAINV